MDVEDQPPSQQENEIQQVPKEEPAFNLFGVRGQPVKIRKLASNMADSLDHFCISIRKIKEFKLEVTVKLHEDNRKLELKMFRFTQTSQEMLTNFFYLCVLRVYEIVITSIVK